MQSAIQYDRLPQNVVPGKTKIIQISPSGNFQGSLQAGQTVQWKIGGSRALLDPYDTYFRITVSFANNALLANDTTFVNKIVQLDNSASSHFSQLLVLNDNEEMERIQEYDSFCAMINDINFDPSDRPCKEYEGVGGYQTVSMPNAVLTAATVPFSNGGTVVSPKTWYPEEILTSFIDTNSRTAAFGSGVNVVASATAASNSNYCANHPILNQRYAFNPAGVNDGAVTYNNGGDLREYYNDYTTSATPANNNIINGVNQHFNPSFGAQGMEPFLSQTVYQRYLNNGFVKADIIQSATFVIPVYSGIIGRLVHPNNYRYVPLWLFKNMILEMTFAQHAWFTSWFTSNQGARAYQVTDCRLMTTIIEPTDAIVDNINAQFRNGVTLAGQTFALGPKQAVPSNQVPPSVILTSQFESLRNLLWFFVPQDYTANAGCRKHFRMSMALTSVQFKYGTDYLPSQPIQGNGGSNYGPINNYEFLRYLYACFGRHCNPGKSAINANNFAINCRAFDPTLTSGPFTDNSQFSLYEENRAIGKAVYGLPLDKLNMDNSTLGGLRTYGEVCELIMQYNSSKTFTRACQMLIFYHYDFALQCRLEDDGNCMIKLLK